MSFPILTIGGEYYEEMENLPEELIKNSYELGGKYAGYLLIKDGLEHIYSDDIVEFGTNVDYRDVRAYYDRKRVVNSAKFSELDLSQMIISKEISLEERYQRIASHKEFITPLEEMNFVKNNTMEEYVDKYYTHPFCFDYVVFNGSLYERPENMSVKEWGIYIQNNVFLNIEKNDIVSIVECF